MVLGKYLKMIRALKKILVEVFRRVSSLTKLLIYPKYYRAESYYPSLKQKNVFCKIVDQILYSLKNGEVNEFYFLFGFDVKKNNMQNEYISYISFLEKRNKANLYSDNKNYLILLRDKFVFGQFLKSLGFKTPSNIALISNDQIIDLKTMKKVSFKRLLLMEGTFFCKIINGECGRGVFSIKISQGKLYINSIESSIEEFKKILVKGSLYILQKALNQHADMHKLYSKSINTLRVTTIRNGIKAIPALFSATLRVGTRGNNVDNWAAGGLIINVFNNGQLDKWAFYKPGYGTKTLRHPDTDIEFDGYIIPNFENIVNKAIELHSYLYGIHSIGWDISIGEDGEPVFIEGNDNWEITLPQATIGGMKQRFKSYLN